ncbi:hypothetical protein [Aeromicrobium sp. REDSEA-S38_B2]|uniref:hypothetical protein n=1 Tax=unclassified Aeromicrobium TaxID=2633570 RepID=UPI00257C4A48|nr:hypothetical protein [Aeromicrobium sp. REDSEA-S38_B2]
MPFIPCPSIGAEYPEGTLNSCESLPDPDRYATNGSWLNFPQVGRAGSPKTKQWAQVPLSMMSTSVIFTYKNWPDGAAGEKTGTEFWYDTQAFFVSPSGSPAPYGYSAPIHVRTLAFGSVPAEITLQVRQERRADGVPEPLRFRPHDYTLSRGGNDTTSVVESASLEARVSIGVTRLKVDGVDVQLGPRCSTGSLGAVNLSSRRLAVDSDPTLVNPQRNMEDVVFDPEIYQYGINGGTLQGTIDIPAFVGCTTASGDDVSPLLTAAVSEDGAPLSIRIGATNCQIYDEKFDARPIPTGVTRPDDPRAGCFDSTHPNPKIVTVPKPFPIPDEAPRTARR